MPPKCHIYVELPPTPAPLCVTTVSFLVGDPEHPTVSMSPDGCEHAEVALAIILAALLKSKLAE